MPFVVLFFSCIPQNVRRHVVFGRVIEGEDVVMRVEAIGSQSGKPGKEVKVVDSGELTA
jgi:cyclophilin family peptidyl-prolyl cis-trans isomerase